MLDMFKSEIDKLPISPNSEVYLAISGGVDSVVLSTLLSKFKINHTLLHCNFKLRKEESNEDENFVIAHAKKHHLKCHIKSFDTKKIATELKLTTQECARKLRYDWFDTFLSQKKSILLTAHHLDDSIETFFINLLRGTGLKGLTGINNGQNNIYRPLLRFNKLEILAYARENEIAYREDSSNSSDAYLRNKLRHHFIPNLKSIGHGFDTKMSTLLNELKNTEDFIASFINPLKSKIESENQIEISDLEVIPKFMWYKLFVRFGLTRNHNEELIKLSRSITGSVFESKTHTLLNNRGTLIISKSIKHESINILIQSNQRKTILPGSELRINLINETETPKFSSNVAFLDADKIKWPLTIRNWAIGDKIIPFGFNQKKLVSKVLKDKKLNQFQKENQFVIESDSEIIWVVDLMISNPFSIQKTTKRIIKIEHIQ